MKEPTVGDLAPGPQRYSRSESALQCQVREYATVPVGRAMPRRRRKSTMNRAAGPPKRKLSQIKKLSNVPSLSAGREGAKWGQ
jgi:hypothetical protein